MPAEPSTPPQSQTRPATSQADAQAEAQRNSRENVIHLQPGSPTLFDSLAVLLLILVAFGLRVYGLTFQSISADEGISVIRSSQTLGEIWQTMPVEHVHGYFLLLHGWFALAGDTDFTLRFLSVLPGVWAVAILYRLGVDLGNRPIGWGLAAVAATNVFQVWYAQEARMYSWVFALAALSCWAFWRLSPGYGTRDDTGHHHTGQSAPPSPALWAVYIFATAGLVYLHYYTLLVPLLQAVMAVGWLGQDFAKRRAWFLAWCGAGVGVLILYAPLLPRILDIFGYPGWRDPLDPNQLPAMLFFGYTLDEYLAGRRSEPVGYWLYGLLAGGGLWFWLRRRPPAGVYLVVLLGLGSAILYALLLRKPDYHIRYSIFLAIPLYALVAGGLAAPGLLVQQLGLTRRLPGLGRMLGLLGYGGLLAALLGINGLALERHYHDEARYKVDFRAHARQVETTGRDSDIILSLGPNPDLVFERYYTGSIPIVDISDIASEPSTVQRAKLQEIVEGRERAWILLRYYHPGPVQLYLSQEGWPSPPTYQRDLRLSLYGITDPPLTYRALNVIFGPELWLMTGAVATQAQTPGLIVVQTQWTALDTPPDLKFSMRLVAPHGEIIQALDYEPVNWFYPTDQWQAGEIILDRHAFFLTETLPPGLYTVTVRLYDPQSGEAIETEAGPDVVVGQVEIVE